MRILIIEDEERLAEEIQEGLNHYGFAADYVLDGEKGFRRAEIHRNSYDLLILDLMLPQKDGFSVCRDLRTEAISLPILVLTGRGSTEDITSALNAGADDYVIKPFSFDELVARVRSLLRRPREILPSTLQVRNLILNPVTREVVCDKKKIFLTTKEFALLEHLMRHPGRVFTREDIIERLWGFDYNSFSNVVDVHMNNLRKKLCEGHRENLLETIHGAGYRIKE